MRYVMVPVPAEHVLDVMRWVLFRAPDDESEADVRDGARVYEFVIQSDELTRSVLDRVATAAIADEPLRIGDLAAEFDQEGQIINGLIRGANATALGAARPIVEVRAETAIGVHGQTGKVSFLGMRLDLARQIRAAVRAADPTGG